MNSLEKLPDSPSSALHLKDWIKGLGLAILFFISQYLPDIKTALTAHDFGKYNGVIKGIFFSAVFLGQRYYKNNTAQWPLPTTNPNPPKIESVQQAEPVQS